MKAKKRVLVGMSGGVDSSVAAALLKKRGYDVIGVTMQLLEKEETKQSACCNLGAMNDAKRVAAKLGIPHYTVNLRDPFKTHVIDNFVSQYIKGFTPNPCVECNRYIKFDELLKKADELGVDYVATGHYCKITHSARTKEYRLKVATDVRKDQSYFLYMMDNEKLKRVLFPLGNYRKEDVRQIAHDFGLINANRPESQDICFIPKKDYQAFVESHTPESQRKGGDIVDTSGKKLGSHAGIYHYTIGQRRQLGISSSEPLYVLKIDSVENKVVVGARNELSSKSISVMQFGLVNPNEPVLGKSFQLKTRYQMTPAICTISQTVGGSAMIDITGTQDFISPGQSAVLYDKDRVVGGGIIAEVY